MLINRFILKFCMWFFGDDFYEVLSCENSKISHLRNEPKWILIQKLRNAKILNFIILEPSDGYNIW